MKLIRAEIVNFRSIKNMVFDFEPSFKILVGINESGKTNIIQALSFISPKVNPSPSDLRQSLPEEENIKDAYVRFVFKLNEEDINTVYEKIISKAITSNPNLSIISYNNTRFSLKDFCTLRNEGLYITDLMKNKKQYSYWQLFPGFIIINNWRTIRNNSNEEVLIDDKNLETIDKSKSTILTAEKLNTLVGFEIMKILPSKLPNIIIWKYSEDNLLPSSIDLDNFSNDPDICIPLKNMFNLAGINNITEEIQKKKDLQPNHIRNLLKRVSLNTTKYFKSVWKEYGDVKFSLEPNGINIDTGIEEKNIYSFNQRSDGFKRFITFLLLLSITTRNKKNDNTLLLIDEPDISLHPSGIKYLRDELIKMSERIKIIASTHSPFFIDSENIDRHLLVKKENEITSIEKASESNVAEEEVLFRALGISVYDYINKINIIFEGWRDKTLFRIAMKKLPIKYKNLSKIFKNIGICHADGVKNIINLAPFFEAANRKCIILSDNDEAAIEKQKEHTKRKGYGKWFRYNEINKSLKQITAEDFINQNYIIDIFERYKMQHLDIEDKIESKNDFGILNSIKSLLIENKKYQKQTKEIIDEIKILIYENLSENNINIQYYEYLKSVGAIISAH